MSEYDKDKKARKWIKEAQSAIEEWIISPNLQIFDQIIFIDQFKNVLVGNDVAFPDIDDIPLKRIRSNRLKVLGYEWIKDLKK